MRRTKSLAAMIAVVAAAGTIAVGCGASDSSEAETPAGAATVANTALQTDSEGKTITAPPAGGAPPAETEKAPDDGGAPPAGDVAAGLTAFQGKGCAGCHNADGKEAGGVGPQLAGAGLDEAGVRTIIGAGRGAMPAGLVSGTDEDNVVAYVLSLQ